MVDSSEYEWLIHDYACKVEPRHIDQLGHMNNAAYLQLFEDGRWDMLASRGFDLARIKELSIAPVILSVKVDFLKEVFLDQDLIIRGYVTSYPGKVFTVRQEMLSKQETLQARADFSVGLFDLKLRRLIEPTPEWLSACGQVRVKR